MNSLPQTTKRRLKRIPQVSNVWEGDRRPIGKMMNNLEPDLQENGECIIWVDASEGFVRAMEIVKGNSGPEAMVRSLLKAIESPHSPAAAARPQKIVVRDREIQFFLRGALQNLDITVDYVPTLVLIDELWRNFEEINEQPEDEIPSELEELLDEVALEIWDEEPWDLLTDHDILKIDLNLPDLESLYACVMGMLGKEYGIILYRSLDSLKKFRNQAFNADDDSLDTDLESAFLQQDCWFVNFSAIDEDDLDFDDEIDLGELFSSDIQPLFGSIHPYEGMSPLRDEEEFLPIYIALQALKNFLNDHEEDLSEDPIGDITHQYDLKLAVKPHHITVTISTMPALANELVEILEEAEGEENENVFSLNDDLIPDESLISLTTIPWELLLDLRLKKSFYLSELDTDLPTLFKEKKDGLPVILVQTTRPKGKALIEKLEQEGGLTAITFNPGVDPYEDINYDLGIFQTSQNNLYIFAQFPKHEPAIYQAIRQWQKKVKKIDGFCGVLVAMGVTGASRSNPQPKDMLGLFETKLINHKDLDLGTLSLEVEWED